MMRIGKTGLLSALLGIAVFPGSGCIGAWHSGDGAPAEQRNAAEASKQPPQPAGGAARLSPEEVVPLEIEGATRGDYCGFTAHRFFFDDCACIVVEPRSPRSDRRWVWKAEFFSAFPKFELAMLERGYFLAYMKVGNTFGCPAAMDHFDRFYRFLTGRLQMHPRPILLGLSRGGLYVYNWACRNPDAVGALYADNPVCDFKSWPGGKGTGRGSLPNWQKLQRDYGFATEEEALRYPQPLDRVGILVEHHVPLVHVAALDDEVVPFAENTARMEEAVARAGGELKVFRHPGKHHPHGLADPGPLADWIEAHQR